MFLATDEASQPRSILGGAAHSEGVYPSGDRRADLKWRGVRRVARCTSPRTKQRRSRGSSSGLVSFPLPAGQLRPDCRAALSAFQDPNGVRDLVVIAHAGRLSGRNLNALEGSVSTFIVGSRISRAPYDLAEHFEGKGDYLADG